MKLLRSCVIWDQPGVVTRGPRGGVCCDGDEGRRVEAAAEAWVETVAATVVVVAGVVRVGCWADSWQQLRAEYCGR